MPLLYNFCFIIPNLTIRVFPPLLKNRSNFANRGGIFQKSQKFVKNRLKKCCSPLRSHISPFVPSKTLVKVLTRSKFLREEKEIPYISTPPNFLDFTPKSSYNPYMKDPKAEQLVQQFFTKKPTRFTNAAKSVTIMKYLGSDNLYHFKVLDRFDISDETDRLDYMNYLKTQMLKSGEMKKHLWTKSTVLF